MAGLAGLGGAGTPRPDQAWRPGPGTTIAPGGAAGVFRGRLVIVYGTGPGSGVFVYDPVPGAGNLVASITEASTDGQTNATLAGAIASYFGVGAVVYAAALQEGELRFWTATTEAGPYTELASIAPFPIGTGYGMILDTISGDPVVVDVPLVATNSAVAQEPGQPTGTAETWHPLTLAAGWSAVAGYHTPSYRLNALGNLELTGRVTNSSAASGAAIASLPSGYYSASYYIEASPQIITGTIESGQTPRLRVNTSGGLYVYGVNATAATMTVSLGSTMMLSAG